MQTTETIDTVFEMRQDGLTYREISGLTGLSRNTIRAILRGKHHTEPEGPEPPAIFDKPEKTTCPTCRNQVYLPEALGICWACYVRHGEF